MGFAIARAAHSMGHEVVLVAGPVALKTPKGVRRVDVVSARDMLEAVSRESFDCFIATAAVADWRPAEYASQKLKKSAMDGVLKLVRNPDIIKTVSEKVRSSRGKSSRKVLIGFAAETGDPTSEASRKCREKGLDLVVANDVTAMGSGFGVKTNCVSFVWPNGIIDKLPLMSKDSVARHIVRAAERTATEISSALYKENAK
jgi:phosphopantothenoylcysteine decarboxylase/phosphopantothenate--cysteine ligase